MLIYDIIQYVYLILNYVILKPQHFCGLVLHGNYGDSDVNIHISNFLSKNVIYLFCRFL